MKRYLTMAFCLMVIFGCKGKETVEGNSTTIPLGPFHLRPDNGGGHFTDYTSSVVSAYDAPGSDYDLFYMLDLARANKMSLWVAFAGASKNHYKNPDETFNIDMWKAEVDEWAGYDFSSYIEDGTLLGHYLVDEPKSHNQWDNNYYVIPNTELDEMAWYSDEVLGEMRTAVRCRPTRLWEYGSAYGVPAPGNWTWSYLDTSWGQYKYKRNDGAEYGNAAAWAEIQSAEADAQGLEWNPGLQVITGGDGSSGEAGPAPYDYAYVMSAGEIIKYGTALLNTPGIVGFNYWKWYDPSDWDYYERPEIKAAFDQLAAIAAGK